MIIHDLGPELAEQVLAKTEDDCIICDHQAIHNCIG